jgi:hypothetical protein
VGLVDILELLLTRDFCEYRAEGVFDRSIEDQFNLCLSGIHDVQRSAFVDRNNVEKHNICNDCRHKQNSTPGYP